MNLEVTVMPSVGYPRFLQNLSDMKFFFHEEAGEQWTINGEPIVKNCVWIKEIEIAARGCFALRKFELEADAYHVKDIPAVITYSSIDEIPDLIKAKLENVELSNSQSKDSVNAIRQLAASGWFNLADLKENS